MGTDYTMRRVRWKNLRIKKDYEEINEKNKIRIRNKRRSKTQNTFL
jgi:hypothetical protein